MGTGTGATPQSSGFMPWAANVVAAACHRTIAVRPLAKSVRDWFWAYSALPGATILSLAMKSTYCFTAATAPSEVKSALPSSSKKSAPCCCPRTNVWWMLLERFEPSAPRAHLPSLDSFLPSSTSWSQVAGGAVMPASANIFLL